MPVSDDADDELRNQLLEVARAAAGAQGWPWLEPVEITVKRTTPGERQWEVRTNTAARGCNVRLLIAEPGFEIIDAGFLPR